jgi:hypothetical protein
MARPLLAVLAATLIGGTSLLSPPPARAADVGLQIVTKASYTAFPSQKRVHVAVDAVATNVTPDPPNGRFYYTEARFAVQPAIRNLTATQGGKTLVARIASTTNEFTAIDVAFESSIFHGQSISFRFTFDIVDPGGVPQRDVRVAASLVAFPVWAFGSQGTPGSSVTVVIPAHYTTTVVAGELSRSTGANGATVLSAAGIPDPEAFFAYLTAERPGAFVNTTATARLPDGVVTVKIRSWDDDPAWGKHEQQLISDGLPQLRTLIGLPYLVHGQLTVEEAAVANLGDYAGVYDNVTEVMRVRYDADDYTTLHEAAHTWFNANLLSGRWIAEAFAEYYAVEAGKRIGASGQIFTLTAQLNAAKIPLNAWGAVGEEPQLTEDYAYAATYRLSQLIAARAKTDGLQRVWRAAHDGESSYQPAHAGSTPEKDAAVTLEGWQRLLDLLDERTGTSYDDLWRQWVITPEQRQEMTDRAATRTDYQKTVTAAGDWELPAFVRHDMGAWQFSAAASELENARAILADRQRIASQATRLALAVPGRLEHEFETATTFDGPIATARKELNALGGISLATQTLAADPTPVEWIGLLATNPATRLDAARTAFEQGEPDDAVTEAHAAQTERSGATDAGRLRVAVGGGSLFVLDGLAMAGLGLRRRRRRSMPMAEPTDDGPALA